MATKALFLIFEHSAGYALFERIESEELALECDTVEKSLRKLSTFSKTVTMRAFTPFPSSDSALENINAVAEGQCTSFLKSFLRKNLPKVKKMKNAKFELGVDDFKLASSVQEVAKVPCVSSDLVRELLRGVRVHFKHFINGLEDSELKSAQLGLGHHYSQNKVRYNIKREDNMVIQSICLLDTVDKDLNNFFMRIKEWYSWHFPELAALVSEPHLFVNVANAIRSRADQASEKEKTKALTKTFGGDKKKAKTVLKAAAESIGFDISAVDMAHFGLLAGRFLSLHSYRNNLHQYLRSKMTSCAPNLQAVVGDTIGARLISHAGGLSNLAKCPASTVQVLGAEKALFRALKTRCSTPKYGLIFHSPFIASARRPDKGKVSRALANKCALASRIDCFGEKSGSAYGERMRAQLDEKLEFLATGKRATSNAEAMRAVRATMVEKAAEAKADRKHGELGGKRKRKVGRGEGKAKKAKIGGED